MFLVILEVTSSIHTLMQNPNDRDAVVGLPKIDHVMLGRAPPVTWSDIGAALPLLWGVGKLGAHGFDAECVVVRLLLAPLFVSVTPNVSHIALGRRGKAIFRHFPHSSGAGNPRSQRAAVRRSVLPQSAPDG